MKIKVIVVAVFFSKFFEILSTRDKDWSTIVDSNKKYTEKVSRTMNI